ncbi:trypsin-like peptidase domain-containing protein [Enterococcus italicus]|uniref:S1C family serine protease n=1 Tax=Enterococcus italicus TaxID=246144 RepID=UPI002073F537|nr:trypsin-like peptidase domain-containing protein [Enterococcus italicus]MCM6930439.1 trypsin-like peptidase domain-containing protein [Enterococcus italicus]
MGGNNMKTKSSSLVKKIGISLLSGVVGGALSFGGLYYIANGNQSSSSTSSVSSTTSSGKTTVSNVTYNVTSDVTTAVSKVQDAVVSIINLQSTSSNDQLGGLFRSDESNSSSNDSTLEIASEGSGVIYKKSGDTAYIVTNNHVVEGQKELQVVLADGTKVTATLVGTDSYTDLAVLKISSSKVTTVATFGDSSALKVGEPAIAIGSPLGSEYANSVTEGIISSLNRQVTSTNDEGEAVNINAIQTDAAINPGNSGGPLINIEGQVVGINSSKIASSSSSSSGVSVEGMGFAIPSNDVVTIINQLEKNGKITRPALGVSMYDLRSISSEQQEEILKVPSTVKQGVVILNVANGTPAEKAGLEKYDVITKIDGKEITSTTELRAALYAKSVGDTMKITFYRESKEKTVTVELTVDQSILNQSSSSSSNSGE